MTFYELLHSVTFDEIIPFLEKKNGGPVCLALYKTHYDMLRLLTPRSGEGENKTASITNAKLDYDGEEPHLDAYPLEGDFWEVCLAKELVIAPDVNASLGEIAACCLWHTSFYGFTEEQKDETFEKLISYGQNLLDSDIVRIKATRVRQQIEAAGGHLPSKNKMLKIPSFRKKMNRHFPKEYCKRKRRKIARRKANRLYNEVVLKIGRFVAACIPALSDSAPISLDFLCNLFYANRYIQYSYQTYTGNAAKRSEWMLELIKKYDAFCGPIRPHAVILVTVSPEHPFCDSDRQLTDKIERMCSGRAALLLKYDDRLGEELQLDVAFYEL